MKRCYKAACNTKYGRLWTTDFLDEHKVEYTLDPDNEIELANLLTEIVTQPEMLTAMGEKARVIAAEKFDKKILTNKILKAIMDSM